MSASSWSSWAEALMLVCFGLAWPVSTLRLLCLGRAGGRGCGFTVLILLGYLAGAASKLLAGAPLPPVFWLYALNACSVFVHLAVQWHLEPVTGGEPARREAAASGERGEGARRVRLS
jgi:hypothetical protein